MSGFEEYTFSYAGGEKTTFYLAAGPKEGPLLIFIHGKMDTKAKSSISADIEQVGPRLV